MAIPVARAEHALQLVGRRDLQLILTAAKWQALLHPRYRTLPRLLVFRSTLMKSSCCQIRDLLDRVSISRCRISANGAGSGVAVGGKLRDALI